MRSRILWLTLVVLCLLSVPCFSDSSSPPTNDEIMTGIGQILKAQETISQKQDAISKALEMTQAKQNEISSRLESTAKAQASISETLSTIVETRLPHLDEQVKSQQTSYDASAAKDRTRDRITEIGVVIAIALSILSFLL